MTPPLPPHLAFERELARDRSWVVRDLATGEASVLRRCAADAARLRHRWRALVAGGAGYLVVERELLPREGGALALRAYVEGTPLRECRGLFGEDRALQLLVEVAAAVGALHRRGVVHGNLHSNNVIVDGAGRPHLVDALEPPRLHDPESTAAPEQLLGHPATVRTDVHALGVIAFELLSGRDPYSGAGGMEALRRVLYDAPPDLAHRCAPVVRRALAKRSWARPANGERFAGVLQKHVSRIAAPHVRYPRRGATFFVGTVLSIAARLAFIASERARRLPARLRYSVPAVGIAAVLVAALGIRFSRTHVLERRVEESLELGQPAVAARWIAAEERRHGRSTTVDKLAGDVRCAQGEIDDCLRLYRRSVEKSSRYASDERLRRNVLQQVGREDRSGALIPVLARLDGVERELVEGTRNDEYWRRWNAVRALEARGKRGRIDYLRVYTLDLLHAGSCSTRRAAVAKIVAFGGRGAAESLRQASEQSEASSCLGDELPRAIAALE